MFVRQAPSLINSALGAFDKGIRNHLRGGFLLRMMLICFEK